MTDINSLRFNLWKNQFVFYASITVIRAVNGAYEQKALIQRRYLWFEFVSYERLFD